MYSPQLIPFFRTIAPVEITDWKNGLLVRSTNWLGDALMTLPAIWQLRELLPKEVPLAVLAPQNLLPIWEACPFVQQTLPMSGKRLTRREATEIRSRDYGAAIILPNSFGAAWDIWKTRIPVRIGRGGRMRPLLMTHSIPSWPRGENIGKCHQLSYYLELVSALGKIDFSADCPSLTVHRELASSFGITPEEDWLVLAPGAAYGPAKQWPAESFRAVAEDFLKRGWRIAVIGGPSDAPIATAISEGLPLINLAGKTDLAQLMAILAAAKRVLANDSGSMHLAAALGKTGVAIFGSTDPVATGPIGGNWTLLISSEPCRPCFQRTCNRAGDNAYACLKHITPQQVISALIVPSSEN